MSDTIEIKTDQDYLIFCNSMLEKYNAIEDIDKCSSSY